eukprot:124346-Amphidinium_carterae.2
MRFFSGSASNGPRQLVQHRATIAVAPAAEVPSVPLPVPSVPSSSNTSDAPAGPPADTKTDTSMQGPEATLNLLSADGRTLVVQRQRNSSTLSNFSGMSASMLTHLSCTPMSSQIFGSTTRT